MWRWPQLLMSASGHLQTCPAQDGMSASPLKADIATTARNVGYWPIADIASRGAYPGRPHSKWKLRTMVSRGFFGSRLLLEYHIIRSEPDTRLCVLGPHVAAGFKPTRIVQCTGLEVQEWNVALIVEPLMIDAGPALGAKAT